MIILAKGNNYEVKIKIPTNVSSKKHQNNPKQSN